MAKGLGDLIVILILVIMIIIKKKEEHMSISLALLAHRHISNKE